MSIRWTYFNLISDGPRESIKELRIQVELGPVGAEWQTTDDLVYRTDFTD